MTGMGLYHSNVSVSIQIVSIKVDKNQRILDHYVQAKTSFFLCSG
jgi:hypothetical protein